MMSNQNQKIGHSDPWVILENASVAVLPADLHSPWAVLVLLSIITCITSIIII